MILPYVLVLFIYSVEGHTRSPIAITNIQFATEELCEVAALLLKRDIEDLHRREDNVFPKRVKTYCARVG